MTATTPIPRPAGAQGGRPTVWRPILEGELRRRALATAKQIASELGRRPMSGDGSLAYGHAGVALLFDYLGRAAPEDKLSLRLDDLTAQRLSAAVDYLAEQELSLSLFGGFTGVAWSFAHLKGDDGGVDVGGEEAGRGEDEQFEAVDAALIEAVESTPWQEHYDLIGGLAGVGLYALARLPHPAAARCLRGVVERMHEQAQSVPEGIAWHTPTRLVPERRRHLSPNGEYDFGVAHGIGGAIGMLAQACSAGVAEDLARPLVEGAVGWLLAHRIENSPGARFPYDKREGEPLSPARTAWCYGDPGIAAVLALAGRCLNRPDWEQEATSIAVEAAQLSPEETSVKDAGLCHGAAGLAHIYNRLYQASGDVRLKDAAVAWLVKTLDYQREGGIAGYRAWQTGSDPSGEWLEREGLLEGAAGVALALLAGATDIDPSWDQSLLMSPAVRLSRR